MAGQKRKLRKSQGKWKIGKELWGKEDIWPAVGSQLYFQFWKRNLNGNYMLNYIYYYFYLSIIITFSI